MNALNLFTTKSLRGDKMVNLLIAKKTFLSWSSENFSGVMILAFKHVGTPVIRGVFYNLILNL